MIISETYHNAYTEETKKQMANEMRETARKGEQELANEMADAFINEVLPEDQFSYRKAGAGMWSFQILVLDPINCHTYSKAQIIFADDTHPRWITTSTLFDYGTVAIVDKFVIPLDRGHLNGASQKAENVCTFHLGDGTISASATNNR